MLLFTYSDKVKAKNNQFFSFRRLISGNPYLLWWYGAAVKSTDPRQNHLQVVFREILKTTSEGLELGNCIKEHLPLPLLSAYRIGSIWQNGKSSEAIDYPVAELKISCANGRWRYKSFNAQYRTDPAIEGPYPVSIYPLPYEKFDLSPLLEFDLDNGGTLLLNGMDFFRAAYGYSVELKRILTTYPYNHSASNQESILNLLLPPIPNGPVTAGWEVLAPSRKISKKDAVFLSHLKYDEATQLAVKKLSNQIVKGFLNTAAAAGGAYSFLEVEPWHTDTDVTIRVRGIPFNDGNSFLGLNVLGISDPHGTDVTWLTKSAVSGKAGSSSDNGNTVITRQVSPTPLQVASTFAPAWDSEDAVLHIHAETVGNQRHVETFNGRNPSESGRIIIGKPANAYSAAPAKGSGHGIGGLVTKVVQERPPRFELMWQEAVDLLTKGKLKQVQWYDGQNYHSALPLGGIEIAAKDDKTPYLTQAFVMKLTTLDGREFICIELAGRGGKQTFTGLMAEANESIKPSKTWIRWILHEAVKHKGVFKKLAPRSIYRNIKVYKHGDEEHTTLERVLGELK